ncbi:hypothetical protein Caci_3970 [Catenulispora acidiphila DSM 44928]|uniref:DUF262 domain-containing protein n=1 Tax=Catenulispora acidiphila (strain DSM 44928 / JCM 14897 / NBRC 102108 / NRRL B-24433 / ID139908) TaxID=479433 RepID=C7QES7_CATAD|nr:DUF262 domain-containing protein [Catenulispora acidiphila]ACU72847.1 hypothetical protein Caci_3970 [Catenulispora acidiphila DSM 44928]
MAEQSTFTVAQLIDQAERFDVPEVQRLFTARPEWVVLLIDSLYRGIGVGAPLLWSPREGAPDSRYRCESTADYWIIDGQGRLTGTLAAFGIRPPWIAGEQWEAMGGPEREVAVAFTPLGQTNFVQYKPGERCQIRLRDLLDPGPGGLSKLLRETTGTMPDAVMIETLAVLAQRLRDAAFHVYWQDGGLRNVVDAFIRHNQRGSGRFLSREECDLAVLALSCPGLQRDIIDPAVADVAAAGFPLTLDRRRIFAVMKVLTPVKLRMCMADNPDRLRAVAYTAVAGARAVAEYLSRCGIAGDELFARRPLALVLATLFARFPQSASRDFARRWLAQALASGRYDFGGNQFADSDASAVARCTTLDDAETVLAARIAQFTEPQLDPEDLTTSHSAAGKAWTLYALACHAQTCGPVSDLADPTIGAGDPALQLHPLWPHTASRTRRTLAAYAMMTEASAERIAAVGGFTVDAYLDLRCSDQSLHAQQICRPSSDTDVEEVVRHRTVALVDMIGGFLARLEPLAPPPLVGADVALPRALETA